MTTNPIPHETLLTQLRWRYATKKFDPLKKISAADWRALEETLVLAPSSFGLQPWRFIVVSNPAVREKLVPVSWNQRQVADASHLVVFAIKRGLGAADVERYMKRMAEVRNVPVESLDGFKNVLLGFLANPGLDANAWAARQAYIALGQFMAGAALLGIDACPMEGLEPARYDEILGLDKEGYATVAACPAGYRAADDKYAALPKVRFPADQVITRVE